MDAKTPRPPEETPGPPEWIRRHRYSVALTAGVVLLAVGLVLALTDHESAAVFGGGFILLLFGLLGDKVESISILGNEIKLAKEKVEEAAKLTKAAADSTDLEVAVFARRLFETLEAETRTELHKSAESTREIVDRPEQIGMRAEAFAFDLERRAGRNPEPANRPGFDIVSGSRRIEVKGTSRTATSVELTRGELAEGGANFIYVVENLSAPNDRDLRIRIIPAEKLQVMELSRGGMNRADVGPFPALTAEEAIAGPLKEA